MIYKLINDYKGWTLFEKVWFITFTLVTIGLSVFWGDNLIGFITGITGMICVILVAKGRISNYIWGIINVALYGYLAFSWGLMGEVMLNWGYFLPMNFIGWYFWIKNKDKSQIDMVKTIVLNNKQRMYWVLVSVVLIGAYGTLLSILHTLPFSKTLRIIENPTPFIDATSTILSILAMYLMVRRVAEQWTLWIVVNSVSIVMWTIVIINSSQDLGNALSMLVMWSAYLINSVYGQINWFKINKIQKESGVV